MWTAIVEYLRCGSKQSARISLRRTSALSEDRPTAETVNQTLSSVRNFEIEKEGSRDRKFGDEGTRDLTETQLLDSCFDIYICLVDSPKAQIRIWRAQLQSTEQSL